MGHAVRRTDAFFLIGVHVVNVVVTTIAVVTRSAVPVLAQSVHDGIFCTVKSKKYWVDGIFSRQGILRMCRAL